MPRCGRHFAAPARLTCLSNVIIDRRRNFARKTALCVPPVVSESVHEGAGKLGAVARFDGTSALAVVAFVKSDC